MIPRLPPSAAFFLAFTTAIASAATGVLDPTFGTAGITTVARMPGFNPAAGWLQPATSRPVATLAAMAA
jgi:hypothetical protein